MKGSSVRIRLLNDSTVGGTTGSDPAQFGVAAIGHEGLIRVFHIPINSMGCESTTIGTEAAGAAG